MWIALLAFVLGGLIAMAVSFAVKNLEKAIEHDYWARDEAINKFRIWILVALWIAIIIACVPLEIYGDSRDKEIRNLKERIERLEAGEKNPFPYKVDTIDIKDVIYDTGRENSK